MSESSSKSADNLRRSIGQKTPGVLYRIGLECAGDHCMSNFNMLCSDQFSDNMEISLERMARVRLAGEGIQIKHFLRISATKSLEHPCSNALSAARVAASYCKADASEDLTDESSETHQFMGLSLDNKKYAMMQFWDSSLRC